MLLCKSLFQKSIYPDSSPGNVQTPGAPTPAAAGTSSQSHFPPAGLDKSPRTAVPWLPCRPEVLVEAAWPVSTSCEDAAAGAQNTQPPLQRFEEVVSHDPGTKEHLEYSHRCRKPLSARSPSIEAWQDLGICPPLLGAQMEQL